jgi:restriction system protein
VAGQLSTLLATAPTTTTSTPSQVLHNSLSQAFHDALHNTIHTAPGLLLPLWPLWGLLGVVALGKVAVFAWKVRRLTRAGMFEIDRMSGHEFEEKLAMMFRRLGYRAEIVGGKGGDYGGDLVVSKDGTRTVVQAKCWKKNVGVKAIQEAVAAKAMYHAGEAMVVTNSRFTKQAHELARKNRVKLWGRDELVNALLKGQKAKNGASVGEDFTREPSTEPRSLGSASLSAETTAVVERTPKTVASPSGAFCARCGDPVSVKVRDYCLVNRERFSGLVYCFDDQRALNRRS